MARSLSTNALAAALLGALALAGCGQSQDETALTPPAATQPAPTPALSPTPAPPEPTPASAATVSVTGLELGNAVGIDMRVAAPMTTFGRSDKIIAAVSMRASDATVPVAGALTARWTFEDGQLVNLETREYGFTGTGVTNFEITKPDAWPVGGYAVEISMDGEVVERSEFEVLESS